MKHAPLTASQMRRVATLSATTRQITGFARVSFFDLCDVKPAANTGVLKHAGKRYAAERVGQFWYLTGDYTEL